MPVLDGIRAWLETPTTLKVPEHAPESHQNVTESYIAARPGEVFSLRYDHIPVPDFDLAWKLTIADENGKTAVEQWGGPPLEMRKSQGIVKVRALRISEDGLRFREFAWANDPKDASALRGTITLSLHLCHFAEATSEVPASTGNAPKQSTDPSHPVLTPPVTRSIASKLWTWYWRDDEPQAVFKFKYDTKERLQAAGIIPASIPVEKTATFTTPMFKGHHHRMSTDAGVASPASLLRYKQGLGIRNTLNRNRGLSVSSDQSDSSIGSSSSDE